MSNLLIDCQDLKVFHYGKNTEKRSKVISLIEKIDKKKNELKKLRKDLQNAFKEISNKWKKESATRFPLLNPCNIGEYVGVDITIKDVVYNIFISEHNQKLFCMFSLDRKNKEYSSLSIKKTMDDADFETLKTFINNYLGAQLLSVSSSIAGWALLLPYHFLMMQGNKLLLSLFPADDKILSCP